VLDIVRSGQWTEHGAAAYEILGRDHGAAVTLILEEMPEGRGPRLHSHPYGETWTVIAGHGLFTAGDDTVEAGAGDVVYVSAGTPHKFLSLGPEPLRLVCIHQAPQFHTDWLE
jgi:mannose-6-phosphate isomerase-like protein (cupin superfamily)